MTSVASYPWMAVSLWMTISLWMTASLGLAVPLTAQEPELRYRLRPGDACTLEIELHQDTHSESSESDEITLYSQMKLDFFVDSIGRQGTIYMTAGYRDLLLSMLAPSMGIDINSESGKNGILTRMLDSLQQHEFVVAMHPSGELRSLEEISPAIRSFVTGPVVGPGQQEVILNTLDEVYGTNAFSSLFNLFVSVYPVVQPIRNWTRDLTYYFNTKPVEMANRYYLSRTTEEVVIIQGMGMLESAADFYEKDNQREFRSSVSGSQTYDFQMDIETGWLKECVSRQRLVIETTIIKDPYFPRGLKIPSYTETLYEVKGSCVHLEPDSHE